MAQSNTETKEETPQGKQLKTVEGRTKAKQMVDEATHFFICSKEPSDQELRLPFKCHTYWKGDKVKDHNVDDGKVILDTGAQMIHMGTDLIPSEKDPDQVIYPWTQQHEIRNTFCPFYYNDFVWIEGVTDTIYPSPLTMNCSMSINGVKEPVPVVASFSRNNDGSVLFGGPLLHECELGLQALRDNEKEFLLWYNDPSKDWIEKVESQYKSLKVNDKTLSKFWPWGNLTVDKASKRTYSIKEMLLAAATMDKLVKDSINADNDKLDAVKLKKISIADYQAALGKDAKILPISRLHARLIKRNSDSL